MKKSIFAAILLLALCNSAQADEQFNPDDIAGEVVTMVAKKIVLTAMPGYYEGYFLIDSGTKIIYHNKAKRIILGSIVKYSTYYNDNVFLAADEVHVYDFDERLLN